MIHTKEGNHPQHCHSHHVHWHSPKQLSEDCHWKLSKTLGVVKEWCFPTRWWRFMLNIRVGVHLEGGRYVSIQHMCFCYCSIVPLFLLLFNSTWVQRVFYMVLGCIWTDSATRNLVRTSLYTYMTKCHLILNIIQVQIYIGNCR